MNTTYCSHVAHVASYRLEGWRPPCQKPPQCYTIYPPDAAFCDDQDHPSFVDAADGR